MEKLLLLGVLVVVISTIALYASYSETQAFRRRKRQSTGLLKESILRKKLEEVTRKRVKVTKRLQIEKVCTQAGHSISYEDYLVLCLVSALGSAAFFRFLFSNVYLGFLFLIVGGFIPYQYMLFKRNRRIDKMNEQIGPCLKMIIERYQVSKDMKRAIEATAYEFHGEAPLGHEMDRLVIEMNLGKTVEDALAEFADRTGNPFMIRFVDYYKICAEIGTQKVRTMLNQALEQYREDRSNRMRLKKEISSIKSEAYIVWAGVPVVAVYQMVMDPGYIDYMTRTVVGQIGTAVIVTISLLGLWFINKKIGAPIE